MTLNNLFNQLSNQEEVEGLFVGDLATEVALFAAKEGISVYPLAEEPNLLKVFLKKGNDTFLLSDLDGYGVMFKTEMTQGAEVIDLSALGFN